MNTADLLANLRDTLTPDAMVKIANALAEDINTADYEMPAAQMVFDTLCNALQDNFGEDWVCDHVIAPDPLTKMVA